MTSPIIPADYLKDASLGTNNFLYQVSNKFNTTNCDLFQALQDTVGIHFVRLIVPSHLSVNINRDVLAAAPFPSLLLSFPKCLYILCL